MPGSLSPSMEESLAAVAAEEEAVARSGDSGVADDVRDLDPWSSGEMQHLETKWLEQKLRHRFKDLERQSSDGERSRSSRNSSSIDLPMPAPGWNAENVAATSSSIQMASSPARIDTNQSTLAFVPSPLSDDPLISASSSNVPPDHASIPVPAAQFPSRDLPLIKRNKCQHSLEYACTLAHLACFGIIGVLIRFGLEALFVDVLHVSREGTALYRDLSSNMVGSFFMGWVGIVLKRDISMFSEPLAVGLSTGLMGSITTFASWNQSMIYLMTSGDVANALVGILIGMELAQMSLLIGVDTAKALKWIIARNQQHRLKKGLKVISRPSPDNFHRRMVSFAIFLFLSVSLWGAALILTLKNGYSEKLRILWLACIVAPPGVWARWYLARLNGRGLGTRLKWLPLGTLLANLFAASLEAVLGSVQNVVMDDSAPLLVGGLQFGFLGCMSTVSTFVAEVYTMHGGPMKSKAYIYSLATMSLALVLGILLYSVPAWAKGYVKW